MKLNVEQELIENYQKLKQVADKLRMKVEDLIEKTESKNFRALVFEKELTQLLSGYGNIERLKIEVLKTSHTLSKEEKEDSLEKLKEELKKLASKESVTDQEV